MVPSQKFGTDRPSSASTLNAGETHPLRLVAATTPAGSATATARPTASSASSTVTGSRLAISSLTVRAVRRETPRSPRATRAR